MKVALVHDYLNEFGGAERVLEALSELFPNAPIYTAFYTSGSEAYKRFKDRDIRVSWVHWVPFFATKLHSPLRFLAPWIWGSFSNELSKYDVVITSASWYVTKGVISDKQKATRKTIEFCYCHTPPRWLYGYKTSIELQRYWPVKLYAAIVGYFMRKYDFNAAQRVDYFIANSFEVAGRIKKFYKRDSIVIYPPVSIQNTQNTQKTRKSDKSDIQKVRNTGGTEFSEFSENYYLVVARLVGGKGLELAVKAAVKKGFNLKIVGASAGYGTEYNKLSLLSKENVEFLGFVSDEKLVELYSNAKGFLALSTDEDFGITPVEAMLCGTPVVAFNGGGYKESVVDPSSQSSSGQVANGVFFNDPTVESLLAAIEKFEKTKFDRSAITKHAQKFSKERFKKEIKDFIESHYARTSRS